MSINRLNSVGKALKGVYCATTLKVMGNNRGAESPVIDRNGVDIEKYGHILK